MKRLYWTWILAGTAACTAGEEMVPPLAPETATEVLDFVWVSEQTLDAFWLSQEALEQKDLPEGEPDMDGRLFPCADLRWDTIATTRVLTVDFGTTNCRGSDGRRRRGRVQTGWQGNPQLPGNVRWLTFEGFFVDDQSVRGYYRIIASADPQGAPFYTVLASDTVQWEGERGQTTRRAEWTVQQTAGAHTPTHRDDVYAVTGQGEGRSPTGTPHHFATEATLVRDGLCTRHFSAGVVDVHVPDELTRFLQLGDGTCGRPLVLTCGGHRYELMMR